MIKIFSPPIAMILLLIAISLSCSKESGVQAVENTPPVSQPVGQVTKTDTLQIEDDKWERSPQGYSSDLRPFVFGKTIVDVFVSFNGREAQVLPGSKVDFFGGQLENSGSQLIFYAPYNEKPFHSLDLTIIVFH
jgi:hypothetical protein